MKLGQIGIIVALATASSEAHAIAESSLAFDSALGFTTKANLSDVGAESVQRLKVGGVYRFPVSTGQGRFSLGITDYFKRSENDLLSADLGNTWGADGGMGTDAKTYGLRFSLRKYLKQELGTTDQAFTHYGLIGHTTFGVKGTPTLKFKPTADVEYYPGGSRTDFEGYVRGDYDPNATISGGGIHFSFSPGLLVSTSSDFSKMYLALSAGYDRPINDDSEWGVDLTLTPSFYLSRSTTSTVLVGRGKKTSTALVTEKESTTYLSPEFWYSKMLSSAWEFRAEAFARFQSSKSGSYNYKEFQTLASIRYRVF
jgi:hypothetical protein